MGRNRRLDYRDLAQYFVVPRWWAICAGLLAGGAIALAIDGEWTWGILSAVLSATCGVLAIRGYLRSYGGSLGRDRVGAGATGEGARDIRLRVFPVLHACEPTKEPAQRRGDATALDRSE
jgi:hypothetical protein